MARHFNPRSPIPKDRLMKELKEGKTLQEIGDKFGRSRSFISENCAMYNINVEEIEGREEKMKKRKKEKKIQSFVDVMYEKIKKGL